MNTKQYVAYMICMTIAAGLSLFGVCWTAKTLKQRKGKNRGFLVYILFNFLLLLACSVVAIWMEM